VGRVKKVFASDAWLLAAFGDAVSLSGDILSVGSVFHDSGKGAVYLFYRNKDIVDNS